MARRRCRCRRPAASCARWVTWRWPRSCSIRLEEGYAQRSLLTGDLFADGGLALLSQRLSGNPDPRVVIIGSSHSALTAAHLLLESGITFRSNGVTIVFRRRPRVFYPDRQAAQADGYADFDDNDICPATGRVYRLAGLRMAARELLRKAWRLGGSEPDPRLCLRPIDSLAPGELRGLLDSADAVIPAFGYRPNTLPVTRPSGERIPLMADAGARRPMVDAQCRVLMAGGQPLPGAWGIGLASGFVPRGPGLGGEPSFDGQTNGLWLYQNGVGRIVLEQMLG